MMFAAESSHGEGCHHARHQGCDRPVDLRGMVGVSPNWEFRRRGHPGATMVNDPHPILMIPQLHVAFFGTRAQMLRNPCILVDPQTKRKE